MAAAAASTTATSATTTTTSTTYNTNITTSSANSQDSNKSPPKGVYKNLRLMHVSTIIVGCTVQLQTKDGSVFEGIFATFSPEFSICLDLAVQIDPKLKSQDCLFHALKNGSKAQEKAFFDLKDIVRITVNDVDLNSAIKEMDKVITDAEISGLNTSKPGERRELECWQDEDGDNSKDASLLSLDEVAISSKNGSQNNSRTGWDAQEMFRYNERKFNVNSTYDEDLHDYTIALPKSGKHDKDWRKKQDRAAAIAREIETNPQSQGRLAKEDGSDDEEEKFSAVVRPGIDTKHQQQQHHQSPPISSQQQQAQQSQHQQHQMPHAQPDSALSSTPPLSHQHQQSQSNQHQHLNQHQNPHHQQMNQHPRQIPNRLNNAAHKNPRPRYNHPRYESRLDSFKNFSRQLNIAPTPRQSQNQGNQMQGSPVGSQSQPSPQQSHQKQIRPQHQSQLQQQQQQQQSPSQQQQHQSMPPKQQAPHQNQQPGPQQPVSQQHPQSQLQQQQHLQPPQSQSQQTPQSIQQTPQPHPPQQATKTTPSVPTTTPASTVDTSTTSERSDTSSSLSANQSKDQSELAKKSTLNPNAKEFVYKPRSPASIQGAQVNGASQSAVGLGPSMDPTNPSPMSQAAHGAYYQQVPIFPHGLPPHQQQPHHPAQFMPNPHMHFQSQIHYMPTPMAPHFAPQQVSPRYIRGNFQNYHHRNGDHMNNVRATYPQTSMAVPTSASGQQFVPSPSGAQPHHMNTFAMGSPQQSIVYGAPHQSVYPMGPSNFHQPHMSHVPNPQTYEGYMPPTQNYVINQ